MLMATPLSITVARLRVPKSTSETGTDGSRNSTFADPGFGLDDVHNNYLDYLYLSSSSIKLIPPIQHQCAIPLFVPFSTDKQNYSYLMQVPVAPCAMNLRDIYISFQ